MNSNAMLVINNSNDKYFQNNRGLRSINGIASLAVKNLGLGVDKSYKNSDKLL
jgi:adenosylmethionine-8-amino-7-oxononanoate aminotransferase